LTREKTGAGPHRGGPGYFLTVFFAAVFFVGAAFFAAPAFS
jgi:hypothetical protein